VPPQVRRGGLWAKHMRLKRVTIGNNLREYIGNLMGTHWELEGNKGKMTKNPPPPGFTNLISL